MLWVQAVLFLLLSIPAVVAIGGKILEEL